MQDAFRRLGFTVAAANELANAQGIDTVEELRELDDDGIISTCKDIRRPGTVIPNPAIAAAADPVAAAAVQPRTVPTIGHAVTPRAEANLKLAAFWCRYRADTSRDTDPDDITLQEVRKIKRLREWREAHTKPEAPDNLINPKDWTKTLESITDLLRAHIGVTGIPLSYVVRKEIQPENDPATGWSSMQREMEMRAPIVVSPQPAAGVTYTDAFNQDNQEVWAIISTITLDTECWTYVKPARRARDGRKAYTALNDHYLGPNNMDHLAAAAERVLNNTSYYGEKKRWTFEKYVRTQVDQHTILEGLTQHGYAGIDDRSKVRHLIDGIKTKELDSVKVQILSNANLRRSFDDSVTLYRDFIKQNKAIEPRQVNVSAVNTSKAAGASTDKRNPNQIQEKEVKDRYYNADEYRRFTPDAKKRLAKLRLDRGHQPSKKKRTDGNRNVSQVTSDAGATDNSSTAETEPTSNLTNPALTRQKGTTRRANK